jgi:katanin p60 ATPase-containing subunit A1
MKTMNVDLSGALYASLEKAKKQYEKAKQEKNIELAKEKAWECAKISKALAKNLPNYSDIYLKQSDSWEQKSQQIVEKKTLEPTTNGNNQTDDEYKSQIEPLISKSQVTWKDIGGLQQVKQLMMETIVISGLNKPEAIKPWKGILLFGPPGTGKTLIAAAAAGSLNATFISVEAGKVLSKYFGESSKLISALYDVARERSPTIVFIDEFDALSISRDGDVSEASRRMLSSLLSALDGLQDKKSKRFVLTLAATNTPWNLDQAVLSRFPRRIHVSLPDEEACQQIIKIHTLDLDISNIDLSNIAKISVEKNYSGRDLSNLCQLSMWNMVQDENKNLSELANLSYENLIKRSLNIRPLEMKDFYNAFKNIKTPLKEADIKKYEQWSKEFGE